jgi:tetratricopeptide (TPR) repeat protein
LQFIGPLAQSYLQESEFEQAAIWLDRLVALDPGNLQVSEAHAILLCQIGRRALALRRLDIALARRPDEAADESTKVLRFTATTLRRYDDAVREMRTSP